MTQHIPASTPVDIVRPAEVLGFWRDAGPDRWYVKDAALDADIRARFLSTWQAAEAGQLSAWESGDDGTLALLLLLDQFPRNMFRGDIRAFSTDRQARNVAMRAIGRGVDARVAPELRQFVYLPLMHSEDLADQEHCCALFLATGETDNLKYADEHADIIRRFGRFPHRNAILGRASTPEELAFLEAGGFAG